MNRYRQLSAEERVQLATLRYQNFSLPRIAQILGRHRSTIWREVQRTRAPLATVATAVPVRRNERSLVASVPGATGSLAPRRWAASRRCYASSGAPEQVAGYLRHRDEFSISHETIYRHVWQDRARGGNLYLHLHLRGARKRKRKRYDGYDSRGRLAGKRHISERLAAVETRRQPSHLLHCKSEAKPHGVASLEKRPDEAQNKRGEERTKRNPSEPASSGAYQNKGDDGKEERKREGANKAADHEDARIKRRCGVAGVLDLTHRQDDREEKQKGADKGGDAQTSGNQLALWCDGWW